jgi:hypothetical protein
MTVEEYQKLAKVVLSCLVQRGNLDFGVNEHAYERLVEAGGALRRIPSYDDRGYVISVVRLEIGHFELEAQIRAPATDEDRALEAEHLARSRNYSSERLKALDARIAAAK